MEQLFNRSDEMMYDVKHQMKKAFPVYREERIKNYLSVLKILSKSILLPVALHGMWAWLLSMCWKI